MNERIKELFKQTALHRNDHTTEQRIYEVEKFAELIVRECTNILMKPSVMEWDEGLRSELSEYNKGWVNGRLLGIEHIKEHFGVEE